VPQADAPGLDRHRRLDVGRDGPAPAGQPQVAERARLRQRQARPDELLWTGEFGSARPPWQARPAALTAGRAAQAALPAGTLPLERLQVIVPAMAATDPLRLQLDPSAVLAAGRNIIAGMVDCLPPPAAGPAPASAGESVAERLWSRLCDRRPSPGLLRATSAALVLLADHELAASTLAARTAASVRADPYAVVGTGLGAVSGALHGGASLGAEMLMAAANGPDDVPRVVAELLRRGERVPGFGHFVYHGGDPRAIVLLDLVRRAAPKSGQLAVADAVRAEVSQKSLPEPNIDFAIATLARVAGMVRGGGEAIFAVARTAGWIAHALEAYAGPGPLRPRAVYTGPAAVDGSLRPSAATRRWRRRSARGGGRRGPRAARTPRSCADRSCAAT
jgi:citrate synthase